MRTEQDFEGADAPAELGNLLDLSAAFILRTQDADAFIRWFGDAAPTYAPILVGQLTDDQQMHRSFLFNMARMIWNKTPLPGNRYRPKPLPKPERNHPCPCSSGRKYKQCCQAIETMDAEMVDFSMMLHVLNQTPVKLFAELPFNYLDIEELTYVARTWAKENKEKDAVKLLEGLFANIEKLDARAEPAFDLLLDCYGNLGNTVKKSRLLEKGLQAPDKHLRSAAMQRICCMHSDNGDFERAWKVFQDIQRLIPNDPSLAHLEIILLHSQGENERAAERAKFWIARLSRENRPEYAHLIEFLKRSANDMGGAILDIVQENMPGIGALAAIIGAMPVPECHYQLHVQNESAGPLMPDGKLQKLHSDWSRIFSPIKEDSDEIEIDWPGSHVWISWLLEHPLAWQSFDIMTDLHQALHEGVQPFSGFNEKILLPLMVRTPALLRLILKQHQAEGLRLEWAFIENRNALYMIDELSLYYQTNDRFDEAIQMMEWLVLTLNPNDNQGNREILLHCYLRQGQLDKALSLADRYPRDMASMQYGHVLALFMADRYSDAITILKQAMKDYPEVYKMLINPKPRRPPLLEDRVTVGGKDEAWYYREDYLDTWQQNGGLDWLSRQTKVKPTA